MFLHSKISTSAYSHIESDPLLSTATRGICTGNQHLKHRIQCGIDIKVPGIGSYARLVVFFIHEKSS